MGAPTIPRCPRCNKQRVLFGGTCWDCGIAEREADRLTDESMETRREVRKGYGRG